MNCNYCGTYNPDGASVCSSCGCLLTANTPGYPSQPAYPRRNGANIPSEYKPLSPWAYFGYQLLFSIPLVGFIMLIVFSCGGTSNVNLKNYARSYWCAALVVLILFIVIFLLALLIGALNY